MKNQHGDAGREALSASGSLAVKTKDPVIFPPRGESQLAAVDRTAHRENAIQRS